MNIDEIIYDRQKFREHKNFKEVDRLRDILDSELVFVFDLPENKQEVYYLTEKYFRFKPQGISHREYVKEQIKKDAQLEAVINAFVFSNLTYRKKRNRRID